MTIDKKIKTNSRSTMYRNALIGLCIFQSVVLIVFIILMLYLALLSRSDTSGTEFIVIGLFLILAPALIAVAFLNIVALPIYLLKYKPHGKELVSGVLSLLLSITIVSWFLYV